MLTYITHAIQFIKIIPFKCISVIITIGSVWKINLDDKFQNNIKTLNVSNFRPLTFNINSTK